ncbi:MAG: GNAT family N-acetyltransferase, partial [Burkholderiales bacterium]
MQLEIPIYSESIFLRSLQPGDATLAYLGWLSDPTINAHLEVRFSPPQSVSDLALFIADVNQSSHTLMLGIFLEEDGRHIGNIKLGPIDRHHHVGDMGFLIGDKQQWGKGYASKAIALLADYAFTHLGLAKLTAGCYAENEGSRRALLKAGFVEEGRRISQWSVADRRQDGILLGRV